MMKGKYKKPLNLLLAGSLIFSLFFPAAPSIAVAETARTTDLIISEYVEGSSNNKAVEIYNGTGAAIDLSQYKLELYTNGSSGIQSSFTLTGTLETGKALVVYNSQANAAMKSQIDTIENKIQNNGVTSFNGDDALVLKNGNNVIDSFGQVGFDPGTSWGYGSVKTVDSTLIRKSSVLSGDPVQNDAFDPAIEWDGNPIDTFSNLGTHTIGNGDPDPEDPTIISIADARTKSLGETVTIKGIVAANLRNTISVQDETGGIAVRPPTLDVKIGDEVTLTGTLAEFRGLLQLDSTSIIVKNEGFGEPQSKVVKGSEVNESHESQLVTVRNVTLTAVTGTSWKNFTATDGTEFIVRDETGMLGSLKVGTTYESITGIVQQFDNDYQIIPRSEFDIVLDSTTLKPALATPGSGTFVGGTTVTLSTTTAEATIYFTVDGSEPTDASTLYTAPIEITEDTILKAVVKSKDGQFSEVATYEYTITDALQIHDIQGEGHSSPFSGQTVEGLEGVVTYGFTLNGSYYYTIQTPDAFADHNPNTSEGILLYSGNRSWPIKVGDLVSVTGEVSEFAYDGYDDRNQTDLKTTQINVRNDRGGNVTVIQSGVELPLPVLIDEEKMALETIDSDQLTVFNPEKDAIDFWESIEGMRVQVGNVKAVAPQEHGDLITVLESSPTETIHGGVLYRDGDANPERIQFRLEPNGPAREFKVATGDRFRGPITGVVGYSFQNFKIYVSLDEMRVAHIEGAATPEKTTILKADDKLTVASYNLENFSNNRNETSDDKARKLARAIAGDMQSPDIVGVTEVQDNNGEATGDSKADQSYTRLIEAIKAAGGVEYKYLNIDPVNNSDGGAPNANIRVGFLYNPARVQLPEGIPHGDAMTAVGYENGKLTHNPGRIDPANEAFRSSRKPLAAQFVFQGEDVIVIANHWNSKSGDTPLFGATQPPINNSEVQRHKIANVVYNFVKDIKTKNPDANVVSLGDFNDYQFSQSLKIHEGQLMTNMINKVEASDRYTYLFQGNSQVLDHILVTNNLSDTTVVDILHINADFTDMAGRASDHDPVMVQLDLKDAPVVEPITPEKIYDFKNFHTKKLTINNESVSITLDGQSVITEGILLKGAYAELHGEGFKTNQVIVNPVNEGAIIDLKGTEMMEIIIDGPNVSEVRGAENIKKIEFLNGAEPEKIKFTNTKGKPITVPTPPTENQAPVIHAPISNKTVSVGKTISLLLTDHFSDPDGDVLTFTATKGTVTGNTLTLNLEEGTHIVGVTATDGGKSTTSSFSVTVRAESSEGDYYGPAIGMEGSALKAALHDIISNHIKLTYSQVWDALKRTDEDPANANNVILLYSNLSRSKNSNGGNVGQWNREHVWAQSHGGFGTSQGPGTDIHHLRPEDVQVNSARGNLDFDNGGSLVNNCDGCKRTSSSFEPPDRVKGDVARMLFYMATRYEVGDMVDLELNNIVGNGSTPFHGRLSTLLEWNVLDPVDEFESRRNEIIFEIQGNRNPFIDHPEWAHLIWSSTGIINGLDAAS